MSLYNIMNKEEEAPERKVFPVVEEEPIAPVAEQPVAVQPAEDEPVAETPKYVYTHWWQTPNYLEEQAKLESATKKRMEQDEQRARNDRNMAIIGDIAKLGAQAFASAGGATKIEKSAPASAIANEKLQAIRDKNALQIENFAKQRMAARQAMAEDNNKRGQLEASLAASAASRAEDREKEQWNRTWKAYTQRKTEEHRANQLAIQRAKAQGESEAESWTIGGKTYNDPFEAYYAMLKENSDAAVTEDKNLYTQDLMGRSTNMVNTDGTQATVSVPKKYPTRQEVIHALNLHSSTQTQQNGSSGKWNKYKQQ